MHTNGIPTSRRHWSWPQWLLVLCLALMLIGALVPTCNVVASRSTQSETANNCRRIIAALKLYAGDHQGMYPDADASRPTSSNQAFRILFREGYIDDESWFGAKLSKFNPDNIIGEAPDFPKALEAGENHWAMTKGLTDSSDALLPLVFENPKNTTWPPTWNIAAAGKREKGCAMRGGKIFVGFNDSSIQAIDVSVTSDSLSARTFFRSDRPMEILDIDE